MANRFKPSMAKLQITGEFGESGWHQVPMPETNGNKKLAKESNDFLIQMESVSLGRLMFISFVVPINDEGERLAVGFQALQEIYDRQNVPLVAGTKNTF